MEKIAHMALLADFYGPLLTEKQKNVWDLHYEQDLSLAEIAELESTSRQAVHDLLKRTERILSEYEDKLGLVRRFLAEREKILVVEALLGELRVEDFAGSEAWEKMTEIKDRIRDISQGLTEI